MSVPITKKGYDRLKEELARLKKVDRPKVIADIAEARSHGDLSENAEYDAAKQRQGFIEGRIAELESKLADAQVIKPEQLSIEKVVFGTTVHLIRVDTGEEKKYELVGTEEADLSQGRISVQSPIGRFLIGHRVGDIVNVVTPSGSIEYEIVKIAVGE